MKDPLDLVGSTVGDEYRVVDVVSRGELSVVYRVRDVSDDKSLALKCYVGLSDLPEPSRSRLRTNLRQVGRLIGKLAHAYDGHVAVHRTGSVTVGRDREVPSLILEWLEGTTMETLLDRDRDNGFLTRSPAEALELIRAPVAALSAAHQFGVVHRNIKPGKLFVCGDLLVAPTPIKLLDFSLAKVGPDSCDYARFLTPEYAAPEQFSGNDAAIGPWTDVFAIALVMVELMLGGRPALRGGNLEELRAASVSRSERPTPRSHGLELPNAVESVFKRALAVDPRERFPTAGQFLQALERSITCEGRVTSTHISRVSGVLNYQPSEDTARRRHPHTPAHGLAVFVEGEHMRSSVVVTAPIIEAVAAPSSANRTGNTVVAAPPTKADPNRKPD